MVPCRRITTSAVSSSRLTEVRHRQLHSPAASAGPLFHYNPGNDACFLLGSCTLSHKQLNSAKSRRATSHCEDANLLFRSNTSALASHTPFRLSQTHCGNLSQCEPFHKVKKGIPLWNKSRSRHNFVVFFLFGRSRRLRKSTYTAAQWTMAGVGCWTVLVD